MKVSVNHIRRYQKQYQWSADPAPQGIDALVEKIGAQLGAVEEVVAFGDRYRDVMIVRIVSCVDHPNANRLHICKIDDGGKTEGVERDELGYVQVVCGAPNAREGILVAWLPPGATVPSTVAKEPFVMETRPLRGEVSNGMLASPQELGIGDGHDGIMEIDDDVIPGTSFADAFDLTDDRVIDMENKMFTHRPDCFGMLGIAREIAGIQGQVFASPSWWKSDVAIEDNSDQTLPLSVTNEVPELVPRFTAITMKNINVKPSPVWLQVELTRLGIRPINNVVDLTNYNMLLTGQPLHAYDYDKVAAQDNQPTAEIVIRHPNAGEKILLLNGKEIEPRSEAVMIASRTKLIGVGGVMGGGDTEVDEHTKNIIIEVASFNMYSIRRTSMAHGLFTDAVTRFNKGQSPLQTKAVLAKIIEDLVRMAGGQIASKLIDDNHISSEVMQRDALHPAITLTAQFVNARLGLALSAEQMAVLLQNVECRVTVTDDNLTVSAPFWRTDVAIPEDVVEEIGRLYGFDHLPQRLPQRDLTPVQKDPLFALKAAVRSHLANSGASEVLTYSFVHGNLLQKVGQDAKLAFQISNALSPDLQYYRLDVLPSILDKVSSNLKAGHDEFALFELGKGHTLLHEAAADGLPAEFEMLALAYAANDKQEKSGAAYYQARVFLTSLAESLGIELQFTPTGELPDIPIVKPYDAARTAYVNIKGADNTFLGIIGEFKASVRKNLKLPAQSAGFEIDLVELLKAPKQASAYKVLPRFPKIEQDICLKVPSATTYDETYQFVQDKLAEVQPPNTISELQPVDIYQRADDPEHKQITLRFSLANYERTLIDAEVSLMLDHVAATAAEALSAERI